MGLNLKIQSGFKNVSIDMRQFNKLKMFLHAESLSTTLRDDQNGWFYSF
jgi:hypothetical protein